MFRANFKELFAYILKTHSKVWDNLWQLKALLKRWKMLLTICYYHVMYVFQSDYTLYSCLNVKALHAQNRRHIWSLRDCNGIRFTRKHVRDMIRTYSQKHFLSFSKGFQLSKIVLDLRPYMWTKTYIFYKFFVKATIWAKIKFALIFFLVQWKGESTLKDISI